MAEVASDELRLIRSHDPPGTLTPERNVQPQYTCRGYGLFVPPIKMQRVSFMTGILANDATIYKQLTGTKVYLGGDPEFRRYRLSARQIRTRYDAPALL